MRNYFLVYTNENQFSMKPTQAVHKHSFHVNFSDANGPQRQRAKVTIFKVFSSQLSLCVRIIWFCRKIKCGKQEESEFICLFLSSKKRGESRKKVADSQK